MSLFESFQFLALTCFLEVIYPRYNRDTIIIKWNLRNICTHSWCLFLYDIFPSIALHITWKSRHVQCKHKTIPFPFSFSLLYNLSSFISFIKLYNLSSLYNSQCLHLAWHLVMYKLLTKILLPPSFCLERRIPY